jgi:flagellar protein FlaJ
MSSSKSSPKHGDNSSFKRVSPFELFYQLTYMSAMSAAGLSRSKTFEIAAQSTSPVAAYFVGVNTLVAELRYDYPEACRRIGARAKSDNMKSFLLRLSDALRSGEPLAEFLAREAEVQGEDYKNKYERDLEGMKQWTNAFSSIVISVALIMIIQMVSSLIYSMSMSMMLGLVVTGVTLSCFGAFIILRSAPREVMTVPASQGSPEQRRALRLFRLLVPVALMSGMILNMLGLNLGWILIVVAAELFPIGIASMVSDRKMNKKDAEFSTFMRSVGGMATSSGTTLKQALTKIDLSSFPTLQPDIERLSTRLQALVEPDVCWQKFGLESGSKLIQEVVSIFYGATKAGGDPERVGYVCSLFTSKTSQLRAKRRLTAGTFSGLTTVMQAIVAGIMVFVLSIVQDFTHLVETLMPKDSGSLQSGPSSLSLVSVTAADVQFLNTITIIMIVLLALVGAASIVFCDGGYKLKGALYLALTLLISGISLLVVPGVVAGILKV